MLLEKTTRSNVGSCNFHDGFKMGMNEHGNVTGKWDHEEVFEFCREANGGLKVRICQKCLDELLARTMIETLIEK